MAAKVVHAFPVTQVAPITPANPSPVRTATVPDGYTIIGTEAGNIDGVSGIWVLATKS